MLAWWHGVTHMLYPFAQVFVKIALLQIKLN